MLITVSGIGGSGKSTCVKQIVDLFISHDMNPTYLRFQRLKCFLFLQKAFYRNVLKGNISDDLLKESSNTTNHTPPNNYKYRKLNLVFTLGYILRIVLFRLYCLLFLRNKLIVLDRYFYDNLVQFHIKKKSEQIFFVLIKKMIPQPDLAMMLSANNEIIKIRRPHRSLQHITLLNKGYHEICQQFNNLIIVYSDNIDQMKGKIKELIEPFWTQPTQ